MAKSVNGSGRTYADSLISGGKVNKTSPWSFSAEDGNKLLGPDGDDWASFGKCHLGVNSDEPDKTKAHWDYPFAKDGTLYRSGLTAIRQRAGQQDDTAIFDAAGALLEKIDGKDSKDSATARPAGYRMKSTGDKSAEILLYDDIGSGWLGGISAQQFSADLKALGSVRTIDLRINSNGGDVFEGRTIYTRLAEHPANIVVHVDGLAASIASLIAMAGDEIRMADGAMMMIHNAWAVAVGNDADMERMRDLLRTIDSTMVKTYCARTGIAAADCIKMMADETWMTGEEAVAKGFATTVAEPVKAAACVRDLISVSDGRVIAAADRFKNLPAALRPRRAQAVRQMDELRRLITAAA